MVFSSNPLSLSVPDLAFDSWLRESGYLEIVDQRTSASTSINAASSSSNVSASSSASTVLPTGFFVTLFSRIGTLLSLFTINPFAKLAADDFSGDTPSWTSGLIGFCGSYSFPSSPAQARLRVQENVKRYARNYASLFLLFFACTLYQMPLALLGLISCLALWDAFKFCGNKWGLDRYPVIWPCLIRVAQCDVLSLIYKFCFQVTAIILIWSSVQMALFCALGVSYTVMIWHAAFRKLSPAKPTSQRRVK